MNEKCLRIFGLFYYTGFGECRGAAHSIIAFRAQLANLNMAISRVTSSAEWNLASPDLSALESIKSHHPRGNAINPCDRAVASQTSSRSPLHLGIVHSEWQQLTKSRLLYYLGSKHRVSLSGMKRSSWILTKLFAK